MDRQAYIDEIKFMLSGGNVLEIELNDEQISSLLNKAFREVQRYIDTTKIITIPYKPCIDLTDYKVNAVARVYRAESYAGNNSLYSNGTVPVDPMYASQWQLLSGLGNLNNFSDYVLNYASWNTLLQIRNTTSTDLAFRFDRSSNFLYINIASGEVKTITIEYIPRYSDVSEIVSDYWIDIIMRLAIALGKISLGRVRSRYTQNNALWQQDGERMLDEGNTELNELRSQLRESTALCYPID